MYVEHELHRGRQGHLEAELVPDADLHDFTVSRRSRRLCYHGRVTYCVGIWTRQGLVMASDSRTNSGHDQVNVACKMHVFVQRGERVFILLSSGSLSCTQSVITLLRRDFDEGKGVGPTPPPSHPPPVLRQGNPRPARPDPP